MSFRDIIFWTLILIGILLFVAEIVCMVSFLLIYRSVNRFFSKHKCVEGKVVGYERIEGSSSPTCVPVRIGHLTFVNLIPQHDPGSYQIVLECQNQSMTFLATYEIPKEDYETYKIGKQICIKKNWEAIGYEVIEKSADVMAENTMDYGVVKR